MKRRFNVQVQNGLGDTATVQIDVRCDLHPRSYTGPAILKARRVLPDFKPWTVGPWEEEANFTD